MRTDLKHALHRFVAVRAPPVRGGFELRHRLNTQHAIAERPSTRRRT